MIKELSMKEEIISSNGMNSQSQEFIKFLEELDKQSTDKNRADSSKIDAKISKLILDNEVLKKKSVSSYLRFWN